MFIFVDASAIDTVPVLYLSYRKIMENTLFGKQLTELLETCEGADVTLNCMGEVFKAHSYILAMRCYLFYHPSESAHTWQVNQTKNISRIKVFPRSAYFKTKLNTDIGEKPKDVDVQECTPKVLSVVLRFIYGISLPKDLGVEDTKQLVLMADLYLMEDLKEAVAAIMAKLLTHFNILEISKMAEKFTVPKLMETCADYVISKFGFPDEELIVEVPQLATSCFKKLDEKLKIANLALGTDLSLNFKKWEDFNSDLEHSSYYSINSSFDTQS